MGTVAASAAIPCAAALTPTTGAPLAAVGPTGTDGFHAAARRVASARPVRAAVAGPRRSSTGAAPTRAPDDGGGPRRGRHGSSKTSGQALVAVKVFQLGILVSHVAHERPESHASGRLSNLEANKEAMPAMTTPKANSCRRGSDLGSELDGASGRAARVVST